VEHDYLIPVIKIATLSDLIQYMQGAPELYEFNQAMEAYRDRYGS
jgi:orotate phosphoribosyltransferase